MTDRFGDAFSRTNATIRTIRDHADDLLDGIEEQQEALQDFADIICDILEHLDELRET